MVNTKKQIIKPRSTAYQKFLLREIIEECMIKQMTRQEIRRFVNNQPKLSKAQKTKLDKLPSDQKAEYIKTLEKWDLSQGTIDRDIRMVFDSWDKAIEPERKKMRMYLWYTYKNIIAHSMLVKDHRTAVAALNGIREMFGLDKAKEIRDEGGKDEVNLEGIAEILKGRFK